MIWSSRRRQSISIEGLVCRRTPSSPTSGCVVCWFSPFWCHFDLVKHVKFVCFLVIFFRMHGRNGLKFNLLMYPDHLFSWLYFGPGLLIFFNLGVFRLSETGIFLRLHGRNGLKFAMLMYPDHLENWFYFCYSLLNFLIFYPSALRAGGVLSSRSGRAAAKLAEPLSL